MNPELDLNVHQRPNRFQPSDSVGLCLSPQHFRALSPALFLNALAKTRCCQWLPGWQQTLLDKVVMFDVH